MELIIRNEGNVSIVELRGRVMLGEGDTEMRGAIQRLSEEGRSRILVHLENVNAMDTTALGQLVAAWAHAAKKGASVKLLRPNRKVLNLLAITRLEAVFDIFDDEGEALRSF